MRDANLQQASGTVGNWEGMYMYIQILRGTLLSSTTLHLRPLELLLPLGVAIWETWTDHEQTLSRIAQYAISVA